MGIETKTKDLQIFSSGAKKADWDVGMAIDAVKLAPKLDAVILITGDGDHVPLVEYLQVNQGCQVEVVSFGKSTSTKLREVADDFIDLDENVQKYLIGGAHQNRFQGNVKGKPNIKHFNKRKGGPKDATLGNVADEIADLSGQE